MQDDKTDKWTEAGSLQDEQLEKATGGAWSPCSNKCSNPLCNNLLPFNRTGLCDECQRRLTLDRERPDAVR